MDEQIRRIQLIYNAGFGAITSLRNFIGTIKHPSVDTIPWLSSTEIFDLRLQRILRVSHFKMPPDSDSGSFLGVTAFPKMHYCPTCGRMQQIDKWYPKGLLRVNRLLCRECLLRQQRATLIPSRFIMICPDGHMDDFPYYDWVHHYQDCKSKGTIGLKLKSSGFDSSLKNIKIYCSDCHAERTMEGALNPKNHVASDGSGHYRCSGYRPEMMNNNNCVQACGNQGGQNINRLRFVLRTASNVYFPIINSAILLPTEDKPEIDFIVRSEYFRDITSGTLAPQKADLLIEFLCDKVIQEFNIPRSEAEEYIRTAVNLQTGDSDNDWESFKYKEYLALSANNDSRNFISTVIRENEINQSASFSITSITEVERMRKIAALSGYTRVGSLTAEDAVNVVEDNSNSVKMVDLRTRNQKGNYPWLPAVELFGEGIFLAFSADELEKKELNCSSRLALLHKNLASYNDEFKSNIAFPNARFVGLHSLSHQFIKEISFEIGYNLASIRERIYCNNNGPNKMNGIFLYIVEQDVMGTLGGLSRLAKDEKIYTLLNRALEHSEWCSNDPVCFESEGQGMGGLNLAACHSCLLLPETCCEHRNRFLDRKIMQQFFAS